MKKFNDYINENLLDKMVDKSDEDMLNSLRKSLDEIYNSDERYMHTHDLFGALETILNVNTKDLTKLLIEDGIINNDAGIEAIADQMIGNLSPKEEKEKFNNLFNIIGNKYNLTEMFLSMIDNGYPYFKFIYNYEKSIHYGYDKTELKKILDDLYEFVEKRLKK